jgi:hypothetical protein
VTEPYGINNPPDCPECGKPTEWDATYYIPEHYYLFYCISCKKEVRVKEEILCGCGVKATTWGTRTRFRKHGEPNYHLHFARPYCAECIKGVVFGSEDGVIVPEKAVPDDIIQKYRRRNVNATI